MGESCFCTAHAAADCEGGGLPPAHDGWCSCACHDGAEATDAIATESTEAVLLRERDEARAERDALLRARDHELHWDPNLANDPNGPAPSDPLELRERFYRLRWALYSLGPKLRAFNMLARLHRLDPSSANAERLVNLVGAEHEDLRVARREREAIATVCGLDACPSICLEALAPAVAKLDAERAALQAKANELPGLTATLDELRWELKVARGDATAGAQALAMIEWTNEENTDLLMRHIDTALALEEAMRVGLEECESLRAQLASVTAERDARRAVVARLVPHEYSVSHSHARAGTWDSENRADLSNKPCQRCHDFADAREALGMERWPPRDNQERATASQGFRRLCSISAGRPGTTRSAQPQRTLAPLRAAAEAPVVELRPLAEERVAGFWCIAYPAPGGVDVIAYPLRQGRPDVSAARCVFAGRRGAGGWLAVVTGKPSRALAAWADRAGDLAAQEPAGR